MNQQTIREEIRPLLDDSIRHYKFTRVEYLGNTRKIAVGVSLKGGAILHAVAASVMDVAISLIAQYDELTTSDRNDRVYLHK